MPPASTDWLVEGLLPTVGTSLVAAPPKCAKSVFTRQLCAFVQMGHPFLGRVVQPGGALYCANQESAGAIAEHFRKLGCTEDTMPGVVACERFDPRDALPMLDQTIARNPELKLVVLDMITGFLPLKDSNDYVEMNQKFAPLQCLAAQRKLHLCITIHTKKTQTENPIHAVIGSQAIAGSVDQVLILNTVAGQQRTITTAQRYGESIPLTLLTWDGEREAASLGPDAEEVRDQQKKATEERITNAMIVQIAVNPGRTREEILDAVKGDVSIKRRAFNSIKDMGKIIQSGSGQKGDPYVYSMSDEDQPAAQAA